MESAAQRRLKAIQGHLISTSGSSHSDLTPHETAGEFVLGTLSLSLSRILSL